MAKGIIDLFSCDIGVSITGYAAPLPEKEIEDIFAWVTIVHKNKVLDTFKITSKHRSPVLVQIDYANQVIRRAIKLFR